MMDENDDPRAPYKVYEGDEQKAHTRRVLKRGGGNSNSKASIRTVISSSRRVKEICHRIRPRKNLDCKIDPASIPGITE
jgi:hypothetical protein